MIKRLEPPRQQPTVQGEPEAAAASSDAAAADADLIESEILVEDVSIDGMCGVY